MINTTLNKNQGHLVLERSSAQSAHTLLLCFAQLRCFTVVGVVLQLLVYCSYFLLDFCHPVFQHDALPQLLYCTLVLLLSTLETFSGLLFLGLGFYIRFFFFVVKERYLALVFDHFYQLFAVSQMLFADIPDLLECLYGLIEEFIEGFSTFALGQLCLVDFIHEYLGQRLVLFLVVDAHQKGVLFLIRNALAVVVLLGSI